MLTIRDVDVQSDRETLLEFHCTANYESESPWARSGPYDQYRAEWLSTPQPESFLSSLAGSMSDERTIAEIWQDAGRPVAYLWVRFTDIQGYELTYAEVGGHRSSSRLPAAGHRHGDAGAR